MNTLMRIYHHLEWGHHWRLKCIGTEMGIIAVFVNAAKRCWYIGAFYYNALMQSVTLCYSGTCIDTQCHTRWCDIHDTVPLCYMYKVSFYWPTVPYHIAQSYTMVHWWKVTSNEVWIHPVPYHGTIPWWMMPHHVTWLHTLILIAIPCNKVSNRNSF